MTTLTFHADPGHGWLAVPHQVLAELGQSDADYSPYSYRDAEAVYLEEDGDAPSFVVLWAQHAGSLPDITETHSDDDHWIRRLSRCSGDRWVSPFKR